MLLLLAVVLLTTVVLELSQILSLWDLAFLFRKIFKEYCALYSMLCERIIAYLKKDGGPCTQRDITGALPSMNRAVLLGYLRGLVDVGKIKSRDSGKAKVYYL